MCMEIPVKKNVALLFLIMTWIFCKVRHCAQNDKEKGNLLYLVEAASSRVLLVGLELLKLCVQDVHQLLHEPDAGADVASKHRAVSVARQLIGQVRRVLSTPDLLQFRARMCDYKGHKLHGRFNAGKWQRKRENHVDKLCNPNLGWWVNLLGEYTEEEIVTCCREMNVAWLAWGCYSQHINQRVSLKGCPHINAK